MLTGNLSVTEGEQPGVFQFLAEVVGVCEVHQPIKTVYREHLLSLTNVQELHKHFSYGRKPQPGLNHRFFVKRSWSDHLSKQTKHNKRHQQGSVQVLVPFVPSLRRNCITRLLHYLDDKVNDTILNWFQSQPNKLFL